MPTMKQEDGRITHRSYAFVDFESASAAQKLCDKQYLMILGKEVQYSTAQYGHEYCS